MAAMKGKPKASPSSMKKMPAKQPVAKSSRGAALKKGAGMAPFKPARGY